MLEAKYRKPQQYDIFIDYLFTHAKVATLEDDTWKVSWEKLRELTEDDVRNFAWRFAKYNNFPVDEVTRQFLEEWKSKPAEILYPYSDNIIVKFRRDLYDKYLLTILQFKYKRVEQIEKKRIKYDVYLYSIHPTLRMTFVLRRGLLTYLPEVLEAYKHPLGSQLPPNPPGPEYPPEGPGEWLRLRPYQWEVLQSIWRNFRTLGAATVRMAAGTGKTEVAVAVTKALRQVMPDRFDKVFFITLNTLLLWQAKRRFEKYGVKAGLVTHQYFDIDQPVVCCTVQTLFKALYPHKEVKTVYIGDRERAIEFIRLPKEKYALLRDAYLSSNLVITDECHHIPARTVLKVLTAHPYALRLALSACVVESSKILTPSGWVRIDKVLGNRYVACFDGRRVVFKPACIMETALANRKLVEIKTLSGKRVVVTEDHPFLTPDGWKRAIDLREGDYVLCTTLSPDIDWWSFFVGLMYAEGNLTRSDYRLTITISEDELEDVLEIFERVGIKRYRIDKKARRRSYTIEILDAQIIAEFLDLKYPAGKKKDHILTVPEGVEPRSFFSGLFTGDGWVGTIKARYKNNKGLYVDHPRIALNSRYEFCPLLEEFCMFLKRHGIRYRYRKEKTQWGTWRHDITIVENEANVLKFLLLMWIPFKRKALQANKIISWILAKWLVKKKTGKRELRGNVKPLFHTHKLRFEPVVRVSVLDKRARVYDAHVPNIHNFIVEGFVTHNTPWRDDESKWEIYATCGKIIEPVVNASYATKLGYLVPAYIIFYVLDLPEYAQTWQLKGKEAWHLVENLVFLNEKRHKIVADIAEYCVNLNLVPVMILVRRIPQGEFITNELLSRGIRAVFLHGKVDLSTRESIVRATERLSFEVLIATQLADEGFDLPPMRALILASGGKSSTRALQRVGRVVRPIDPKRYPEAAKLGPKKWGIVVDIADNAKFLLKHAQMREMMYRTEEAWKITAVSSKVDLFRQIEYAKKLQFGEIK